MDLLQAIRSGKRLPIAGVDTIAASTPLVTRFPWEVALSKSFVQASLNPRVGQMGDTSKAVFATTYARPQVVLQARIGTPALANFGALDLVKAKT